jgi:hypothetical protein
MALRAGHKVVEGDDPGQVGKRHLLFPLLDMGLVLQTSSKLD